MTVPSAIDQPEIETGHQLRWWLELVYISLFYVAYSVVRDLQSTTRVSVTRAFSDARLVISLEEHLHLFVEHRIQQTALHFILAINAANIFYGPAHFIVTGAALVWLFRRHPERYPRYRTALAVTTAAALIGFATFPVMPPRLLPTSYGLVDTLARYATLWSFDSGTMHNVSNQFAAMPSLHFAWATWVTLALWPVVRRPVTRLLVVAYPLIHRARSRHHRQSLPRRSGRRARRARSWTRRNGAAARGTTQALRPRA